MRYFPCIIDGLRDHIHGGETPFSQSTLIWFASVNRFSFLLQIGYLSTRSNHLFSLRPIPSTVDPFIRNFDRPFPIPPHPRRSCASSYCVAPYFSAGNLFLPPTSTVDSFVRLFDHHTFQLRPPAPVIRTLLATIQHYTSQAKTHPCRLLSQRSILFLGFSTDLSRLALLHPSHAPSC